jgi:hypothetical protein
MASDGKRQRTGQFDGNDFLSLGIAQNTRDLPMSTGIEQGKNNNKIVLERKENWKSGNLIFSSHFPSD